MEEIWKDIEEVKGDYQISDQGRVKSLSRTLLNNGFPYTSKEFIMARRVSAGYITAAFRIDGKSKSFRVNRLVAAAFIPNPENKSEVNHIDGDKGNNLKSNLEWATHEENMIHAGVTGLLRPPGIGKFGKLHHMSKTVLQISLAGEIINTFFSTHEASRLTGFGQTGISKCAKGIFSQSHGFVWKYKEE